MLIWGYQRFLYNINVWWSEITINFIGYFWISFILAKYNVFQYIYSITLKTRCYFTRRPILNHPEKGRMAMHAKYILWDICFLFPVCLVYIFALPIYPISLPTSLSSFCYPFVVYPKRYMRKMGRMRDR